jgi:outer membrane protein assembly factor BamD
MIKTRAAPFLLVPALLVAVSLAGCASKKKGELTYIARDVETLYNLASDTLTKKQYAQAGLIFDEVERQHPYSVWARRAQLMSSFAYYKGNKYEEAILAAQRFLSLHPGNKDAPYAYYLIAVSYYEQISDVSRDQKSTEKAVNALTELIRRYPNTEYASDARLKLDLTKDHLAGKDMEVGRFYQQRADYIAASVRFRNVVDKFETTTHTAEALHRLVEIYLQLGMQQEAERMAALLGHNYPGSKWYERSYALIQKSGRRG